MFSTMAKVVSWKVFVNLPLPLLQEIELEEAQEHVEEALNKFFGPNLRDYKFSLLSNNSDFTDVNGITHKINIKKIETQMVDWRDISGTGEKDTALRVVMELEGSRSDRIKMTLESTLSFELHGKCLIRNKEIKKINFSKLVVSDIIISEKILYKKN